jgi:hypothetical protein
MPAKKTNTKKTVSVKPKNTKTTSTKKQTGGKKTVAAKTVTKNTATKNTTTKNTTKQTGGKKNTKKSTKKTTTAKGGSKGGSKTVTRYFKVVIEEGDAHGRFSGSKPKQAANKALTSILKGKEKKGKTVEGEIKFSIVECTRGSKHKTYNYVGERVQLKNPMEVTIGKGTDAKVITYRFNNRVMKDKTSTPTATSTATDTTTATATASTATAKK